MLTDNIFYQEDAIMIDLIQVVFYLTLNTIYLCKAINFID